MVDTISALGSIDYRHDEWGVDVTVAGSQKGLMLPPGLAFNAVSARALAAADTARLPRAYWDWRDMLTANAKGYFPYTPSTNLLYGLHEALAMLQAEGLPRVFARHERHARATRLAVAGWGLELLSLDPAAHSHALTAVMMPEGHGADALRKIILPQATIRMLPAFGSVLTVAIKDTAIATVIAVPELMHKAETIAGQSYRPIEVFTAVIVAYFVILFPVTRGVDRLYQRYAHLGRS
ncbi:hypothetical protein G6F31_017634 [Rhizopus arrhizus]|nr:hypothetical protein G6F31_017634 [Rhizopus arrhizus]